MLTLSSSYLKKCSQCHAMYYCSSRCQAKDWRNVHSLECNYYALDSQSEYPVLVKKTWHRFVLRVLLIVTKHPAKATEEIDTFHGPRSFLSLLNHNEEMLSTSTEKSRLAFQMACDFEKLGVPITKKFFCDIFGKLIINSFSIFGNNGIRLGSGVYIASSVFNHSCYPNATYVFDGLKMQVRAVKEFDSEKEPPRISYLDWKLPKKERQSRLLEQYYFLCDCYRCVHSTTDDDSELDELQEKFTHHIMNKDYRSAFDYGLQIVGQSAKQYPYPYPSLVLIILKLLEIGCEIGDDRTVELIPILKNVFQITYGVDHSMAGNLIGFGF